MAWPTTVALFGKHVLIKSNNTCPMAETCKISYATYAATWSHTRCTFPSSRAIRQQVHQPCDKVDIKIQISCNTTYQHKAGDSPAYPEGKHHPILDAQLHQTHHSQHPYPLTTQLIASVSDVQSVCPVLPPLSVFLSSFPAVRAA